MAQLKNTTISDIGSLNLPVGTTGQRPASPSAGMIRYNTTISDTEYYDGTAWRSISDTNPATIEDTELVNNGTFDTDTSGWSLLNVGEDTATVQNGRVTVNCGNSAGYVLTQIVPTVIGRQYQISFDVISSSNGWSFEINNQSGSDYIDTRNNLTTGTFSYTITANTTTTSLTLGSNNGVFNSSAIFDNVSMREVGDSTIVDTDINGVPYRIHYFTNTGNSIFNVVKGGEVEYLIVAGGGGGGGYVAAAGGGGGGVLTGTTIVSPQNYTITVGAGGSAGPVNRSSNGGNGGDSSAFGLTAIGGGGGGRGWSLAAGNSGGSAGGTGGGDGVGGAAFLAGVAGTTGQGNAGGGGRRCSQNSGTAGGGGGAGSAGTTPVCDRRTAGRGGQGIVSSITGTNNFYAGGGGSDSYSPVIREVGGIGGGGSSNGSLGPKNGAPNTGGGAGSAGNLSGNGGVGGSGIVIIRYRRNIGPATTPTKKISSIQPNVYNISNRSGLVLELDANNIASYNGTGSTWNDISGQGNNFLINPLAFKTEQGISYMDFNGSYGCAKYATGSDLIISGNVTVICWTRILNSSSAWRTLIRGTSGSSGPDHQVIIESGGWRIGMYDNTNGTGFNASGADQRDLPGYGSDQWNMLVWRWNDATTPYYNFYYNDTPDVLRGSNNSVNSRFKHGFNSLGAYGNNTGTNVNSSSQFWGDISSFYMFNRFISNDEVLNIFNATRSRYGI